MSQSATRTGILVGVDGSAESDAAIRWATDETVMRRAPLTLATWSHLWSRVGR